MLLCQSKNQQSTQVYYASTLLASIPSIIPGSVVCQQHQQASVPDREPVAPRLWCVWPLERRASSMSYHWEPHLLEQYMEHSKLGNVYTIKWVHKQCKVWKPIRAIHCNARILNIPFYSGNISILQLKFHSILQTTVNLQAHPISTCARH